MKNINNNAPVKSSKTITIKASINEVWSVLSNINRWPEWQNKIPKAKLHGKLEANTNFDWVSGGMNIHSTLHMVVPEKQLGWIGKSMGIFAIHNWTLQEQGGIVIVAVEESMEGFPAKVFSKSFNKVLAKGLHEWLELLKAECESEQL